jgi:L-asparaginase/Glu-tRNA(Gln) amidotransferase subunit D
VSPSFPPLAEVGLDISLSDMLLPSENKLKLHKEFESEIFCIRFHPGLSPEYLNCILESKVKAVVIQALGMGNVSIRENSIIQWIEKMKEANKIVVINSENPYSRVNLNLYEGGKMMEQAGAISAGDMTTAATIVKLMYLLGKYPGKMKQIKKDVLQPIAGEVSINSR